MSAATPEPHNLPNWMIIFSFIASLLLSVLAVLEVIFRLIRRGSVEIVLTRDIFFRILEAGETLYANAVIVAYDVGALIKDIKASLVKENGATKQFSLKVVQIGEKYRTPDGLYQFSFHSASPLTFIPENNPQRQVYLCEHESYAEATRQEFQKFQQRLFQIKENYSNISTLDQTGQDQFLSNVNQAITNASTNIMDKIQIEPGKYTLTINIAYRQKGKFIPLFKTKWAESKIQFTVASYARDFMRYSLNEYLRQRILSFLTNQGGQIAAPEYSPSNVIELSTQ